MSTPDQCPSFVEPSDLKEKSIIDIPRTPISWTSANGRTYVYASNPMRCVACFILLYQLCERFCYYGFIPLLQDYVGDYMGNGSTEASVLVNAFKGFLHATPILSAIVADTVLEVYWTFTLFAAIYLIGVAMLAVSPLPGIFGTQWYLSLALMGFIAIGGGGLRSCVSAFGGAQFHPEKQKEQMTSFYTYYFAVINLGALLGMLVCTQLHEDVSYLAAFTPALGTLVVGLSIFYAGTPRYVRPAPQGSAILKVCQVYFNALKGLSFAQLRQSSGGQFQDSLVTDSVQFMSVIPVLAIGIPFTLVFCQCDSVWITQSNKLDTSFFGKKVDPALIQVSNPIACVIAALLIERVLYPKLKTVGLMPGVITRFIIGLILGALSLACAMIVEDRIIEVGLYQVNAGLQFIQYAILGIGEVFVLSTSYEVAYSLAPQQLKTLSSAVNLLMTALAYFATTLLVKACEPWLVSFKRSQATPFQTGEYNKFFGLHIGFCAAGIVYALALKKWYKDI